MLGKYCQTAEVPDEIVSDGNEMYVTFTADSSGNNVGFLAYYYAEYADKKYQGATSSNKLPTDYLVSVVSR